MIKKKKKKTPLHKVGIEGTYLNIVKNACNKTTTNIILNGEELKAFPLRSDKTRMSTLTTTIRHSLGTPSHSDQRIKSKEKIIQIEKE